MREDVLAKITQSIATQDAILADIELPRPVNMQKPTLGAMQQKNFIQNQNPASMMGGVPRGANPQPPPPPSGGMPPAGRPTTPRSAQPQFPTTGGQPPPAGMPPVAGQPPSPNAFDSSGYAPPASQPVTAPYQSAEALAELAKVDQKSNRAFTRTANDARRERALGKEQEFRDDQALKQFEAQKQAAGMLYKQFRNAGMDHQQAQDRADMLMADPEFGNELRQSIIDQHENIRAERHEVTEAMRGEKRVDDREELKKDQRFFAYKSYEIPTPIAGAMANNTDLTVDQGVKLYREQEKARLENAGNIERENAKLRDVMYKADQTINTVEKALGDVSPWTTGFGSVFAYLPSTPAKDLKEAIETLNATQGFKELFDMRQASATGGALGNVSNKEIELLYRAWTSLETKQSTERVRENLNEVLERFQRVKILTKAESEGKLLGMSPEKQEAYANDKLSYLKHDAFQIDNPVIFKEVMDGVRAGTITEEEFEKSYGFIPIPDNLRSTE